MLQEGELSTRADSENASEAPQRLCTSSDSRSEKKCCYKDLDSESSSCQVTLIRQLYKTVIQCHVQHSSKSHSPPKCSFTKFVKYLMRRDGTTRVGS